MDDHPMPGGIINPTQQPMPDATPPQTTASNPVRISITDGDVPTVEPAPAAEPAPVATQIPIQSEPVAEPSSEATTSSTTTEQTQPKVVPIVSTPASVEGVPTPSEQTASPTEVPAATVPESAGPMSPPEELTVPDELAPSVAQAPVATPQEAAPAPGVVTAQTPAATPSPKKKFGTKKLLLIVPVALLFLGVSSAGAYFGYVLPNKPENRILAALKDFANQKNIVAQGVINSSPEQKGTAVSVVYKLAGNLPNKQASLAGTFGVNGTQFPYEARYLDKNIYVKVGGLGNLATALGSANAGVAPYTNALKTINDQWYVVDSSFLDSLGAKSSCITDLSLTLTKDDISLIGKAYKEHPLFTVKSSQPEVVDGVKTTRFTLDPSSDAEAAAFANELEEVSIVKNAKQCVDSSASSAAESVKSSVSNNKSTYTITINITGKDTLKKIEIVSKDATSTTKVNAVFTYAPVTVTKPDNAKPIQDLVTNLTQNLLAQ